MPNKDPEKAKQWSREYHAKHREERNARSRRYRQQNRERMQEQTKEWLRQHPGKAREYNRRCARKQRLERYGITQQEYDAMVASQEGRCACCGTDDFGPKGMHVDHDHVTGRIRGLLCHLCNAGIGFLGDNAEGVTRALDYLRRVNLRGTL